MLYDRDLIERLTGVFRKVRLHIVPTHVVTDLHDPDHESVHQLTRWAARSATVNGVLPDLPMLTYVPQIFAFEPDRPTLDRFTPDVYVDVTDTNEQKKEAMACVPWQFEDRCERYMDRPRFRASIMKNLASQYAEAFVRQCPFEGDRLPI